MNLCVVRGRVARPATERILPDERSSWSFEVRIAAMPSCPGTSVPVVWEPANRGGEPVTAGEEVVVVGAVRQRFFRAGGATQSRTEVLASSIVAANRRAGARRALERVVAALDG